MIETIMFFSAFGLGVIGCKIWQAFFTTWECE